MTEIPHSLRFNYPDVPKHPVTRTYQTIDGELHFTDNYAWLQHFDSDPQVLSVIAEQNAYTQQYFDQVGTLESLEQRFEALTYADTSRSLTRQEGGYELFRQLEPGDNYGKAMARKDGIEQVLIDPNTMTGGYDIMWFKMAPSGQHLVYALQQGDKREPIVFIRDMESGSDQQFYTGTACDIDFDADGKGFIYITCEGQDHKDAPKEASRYSYQRISHHRFDQSIEQDTMLLDAATAGLGSDVSLAAENAADGRTMLFEVWHGRDKVDLYLLDKQTKEYRQMLAELPGQHNSTVLNDRVYVTTRGKEDKDRVISCTIQQAAQTPLAGWDQVIARRPGQEIKSMQATKSDFIVTFSDGVTAQVVLFNRHTGQERTLPMPDNTSIQADTIQPDSDNFQYEVGNVLLRSKVYAWNGADSRELYNAHQNLDIAGYETIQESYVSFEGKEIPLLLAAAKGVIRQQDAALMMECYGGFSASTLPHRRFNNYLRTWLDLGQIVAFPFLSGDGSTRQNYEDGIKQYKYRVPDEINAAARHIHHTGIASRVGLTGGSNGGLMVMAAALKQPQWYMAADVRVPLANMFEFHTLFDGAAWIREYGDPRKPEQLAWLQKYSAYHLVEPSLEALPSMFISTGLNDKGVHPVHAIAMAARRQALQPNARTLLNVDAESGHGYGKSARQWHYYYAQRIGFMLHELGVDPSVIG